MSDQLDQVEVVVVMDDGATHTTLIQNPDMIRYEDNAARLQLGTAKLQPIKWLTYCTWAALTREKVLDGMPFDAFKQAALSVRPSPARPADPTRPDRGDG